MLTHDCVIALISSLFPSFCFYFAPNIAYLLFDVLVYAWGSIYRILAQISSEVKWSGAFGWGLGLFWDVWPIAPNPEHMCLVMFACRFKILNSCHHKVSGFVWVNFLGLYSLNGFSSILNYLCVFILLVFYSVDCWRENLGYTVVKLVSGISTTVRTSTIGCPVYTETVCTSMKPWKTVVGKMVTLMYRLRLWNGTSCKIEGTVKNHRPNTKFWTGTEGLNFLN